MRNLFILNIIFSLVLNLIFVKCYIVPDQASNINNFRNGYNDLQVQTDSGLVYGEARSSQFGANYQIRQFIGIPYAQKPIDIYRFSVSSLAVLFCP